MSVFHVNVDDAEPASDDYNFSARSPNTPPPYTPPLMRPRSRAPRAPVRRQFHARRDSPYARPKHDRLDTFKCHDCHSSHIMFQPNPNDLECLPMPFVWCTNRTTPHPNCANALIEKIRAFVYDQLCGIVCKTNNTPPLKCSDPSCEHTVQYEPVIYQRAGQDVTATWPYRSLLGEHLMTTAPTLLTDQFRLAVQVAMKNSAVSTSRNSQCPVCWSTYNNNTNLRTAMSCGHQLCNRCNETLKWRIAHEQNYEYQCPTCRAVPEFELRVYDERDE